MSIIIIIFILLYFGYSYYCKNREIIVYHYSLTLKKFGQRRSEAPEYDLKAYWKIIIYKNIYCAYTVSRCIYWIKKKMCIYCSGWVESLFIKTIYISISISWYKVGCACMVSRFYYLFVSVTPARTRPTIKKAANVSNTRSSCACACACACAFFPPRTLCLSLVYSAVKYHNNGSVLPCVAVYCALMTTIQMFYVCECVFTIFST